MFTLKSNKNFFSKSFMPIGKKFIIKKNRKIGGRLKEVGKLCPKVRLRARKLITRSSRLS